MDEKSLFEQITTAKEPRAHHRVSKGFRVGNLLFLSGQLPVDDEGNIVGANDFEAQAHQVFRNLEAVLIAGGSSLKRVIKTNIYLTEDVNRPIIHKLRERYFSPPYPASTMVTVPSFAEPEFMLEIEVVAVVTSRQE